MAFDPATNLLTVQTDCRTIDQFIERHRAEVGQGGMFIACPEPPPVGQKLQFEVRLAGGGRLLAGEGTVIWVRAPDPGRPEAAPGVGVRFERLAADSQQVLERILAQSPRPQPGHATSTPAMAATLQVAPERVAQLLAAAAEEEARSQRATLQVEPEQVAHLLAASRPGLAGDGPAPPPSASPLAPPSRRTEWMPWVVVARGQGRRLKIA